MALAPEKFYQGAASSSGKSFASDLGCFAWTRAGNSVFAAGTIRHRLGVQGADKLVERAYFHRSSPYEPQLEFFVELVPQGALTPLLYNLQVGDTLSCRKVPRAGSRWIQKRSAESFVRFQRVTGHRAVW